MLGICGMVAPRSRVEPVTDELVRRMANPWLHAGAGERETWLDYGVALCHQSLDPSIRPRIAVLGSRYRLVVDGDVAGGAVDDAGRSPGGPERLLRQLETHGASSLASLGGAFAGAIWDGLERRLTLVRDRLGSRPLYYYHAEDGRLFFGSEIKALFAGAAVAPRLNHAALPGYLALGAPPDDATLFEGVRRVPPGHAVVWQDGRVRVESHWELPARELDATAPKGALIERFGAMLRDSARRRLRPDSAPGVLLSGSMGSAAVLAVLSELSESVETFSVHLAGCGAQELERTRSLANRFGARHHEVLLTADEFFRTLPMAIWHLDEPLADPSLLAHHHAAVVAADRVRGLWSETGSAELLGGPARYRRTLAAARLARVSSRLGLAAARSAARNAAASGAAANGAAEAPYALATADERLLYLDARAAFDASSQRALLTNEARERGAGDPYDALWPLLDGAGGRASRERLWDVDLRVLLPERIIAEDVLGRGVSCATQSPFLDHALVEFIARVGGRLTLRDVVRPLVTAGRNGRVPTGLMRPWRPTMVAEWLRGAGRPLLHEYVLDDRVLARGILRPDAVGPMVAEHESGRADHSSRLWSLINLEMWHRLYIDAEAATPQASYARAV